MYKGDGLKAREGNDSWKARIDRLEENVKAVRGWSDEETVRFLALSLCGEAGELANEIKKVWRKGGYSKLTNVEIMALNKRIAFEIADCRMILYRIAQNLEIDEDTSCDEKLDGFITRPENREFDT